MAILKSCWHAIAIYIPSILQGEIRVATGIIIYPQYMCINIHDTGTRVLTYVHVYVYSSDSDRYCNTVLEYTCTGTRVPVRPRVRARVPVPWNAI